MSTNGDAPLVEVESLVKYFPIEQGLLIREVYSEDDNLEAVFKYLVQR